VTVSQSFAKVNAMMMLTEEHMDGPINHGTSNSQCGQQQLISCDVLRAEEDHTTDCSR